MPPSPEQGSFGPNQLEQLYELEKALRLMPADLGIGGSYGLRRKQLQTETFSFTDDIVELRILTRGANYHCFHGLLHTKDPDTDNQPIRGLLTMDGIVVKLEFEVTADGQQHDKEIEVGYFLGEISPGQVPDSPLSKSLSLVG